MDLRQLRSFVHVAELGSISMAAQRLNLAQSAVTRQLQLLEADLGICLLHRHGRGVTPTLRGEFFLRRARAILRDVSEAQEEVRGEQLDLQGTVGVGLPPDLARPIAHALLRQVAEEMPNVSLRISTGYGADMVDLLNSGSLDLAILCHAAEAPSRKSVELAREELSAIVPEAIIHDRPQPWSLADIAELPLLLPARRHFITMAVEATFAEAGLRPRIAAEVDDLPLLMNLVAEGRGVSLAPSRAIGVAAEADRDRLRVLALQAAPARSLTLTIPLDRLLTPAALQVRKAAIATARAVLEGERNGRGSGPVIEREPVQQRVLQAANEPRCDAALRRQAAGGPPLFLVGS